MRLLKITTLMIAISSLSVLVAPGFYSMPKNGIDSIAHGAMPAEATTSWLVEISKILGCPCGCDLTLKECQVDDPDCQVRPRLIQQLQSTRALNGPSQLRIGGCTCGCGYNLIECSQKHKGCTQRPRIHQQLKRLAIKYEYPASFQQNSGLSISDAEKKIFSEALNGHTSILYVHKEKNSSKSPYMKTLLKFQKQYKQRLAVIPVSLTDSNEKNLLKYYRIENPAVTMVAPNGAVTAVFKGQPPVKRLKRGLVSPKMEEVLLAIQQGMTSFICVGRPKDKYFQKAQQTVSSATQKLGGIATAIWLDPADRSEASLLSALKYKSSDGSAPVFVIAPTGLLIEKIERDLTERKLFDSFQKILAMKSGCGLSTITGGSACQPGFGVTGESSCQ